MPHDLKTTGHFASMVILDILPRYHTGLYALQDMRRARKDFARRFYRTMPPPTTGNATPPRIEYRDFRRLRWPLYIFIASPPGLYRRKK